MSGGAGNSENWQQQRWWLAQIPWFGESHTLPPRNQRPETPPQDYQQFQDQQRHVQRSSSSTTNLGRNSAEAPLLPFRAQHRRQQTPVPEDGEEDWVTTDSGSSSEYQDADEIDTEPEKPRDKRRVENDKGEQPVKVEDSEDDQTAHHAPRHEVRRRSRSPEEWKTEEYRLRDWCYNKLISMYGKPQVEAFASTEQRRLREWWGPGSPYHEDAFSVNWAFSRRGLIYMNPPFSMLQKTVLKIMKDRAKVIIIIPHWPTAVWFTQAMIHARQRWCFGKNEEVFTFKDGGIAGSREWAVWGVFMDSEWVNDNPNYELKPRLDAEGKWQEETKANRRRKMRKKAKFNTR